MESSLPTTTWRHSDDILDLQLPLGIVEQQNTTTTPIHSLFGCKWFLSPCHKHFCVGQVSKSVKTQNPNGWGLVVLEELYLHDTSKDQYKMKLSGREDEWMRKEKPCMK